jgi:hypothetical protein
MSSSANPVAHEPANNSTRTATAWVILGLIVVVGAITAYFNPNLFRALRGLAYLVVALVYLVAVFARRGRGARLRLQGGGELYYTPPVTKAEASSVAAYFNAGRKGARGLYQLSRKEHSYQLRVSVLPGTENNAHSAAVWQDIAGDLSEYCLGHAPIEVHLCNGRLKTLRVIAS